MSRDLPTPNASGTAVFTDVRDGLAKLDASDERRHRDRFAWKTTQTVWVIDEPERDSGPREIMVETTDISQTGFGFVYRQFIHPGAVIRMKLAALPGSPTVEGIVAHCQHTGDSVHRVGVQFVSSA